MKQNKGFLLMDVLLAAAFLGVITITLFPTVAFLLRRNVQTQGTIEANLLVQEGIEIAYNAYANNWSAYEPGTYIKAVDTTSGDPKYILTSGPEEVIEAKYTRTITVENVSRSTADGKQDAAGKPDPKSKKVTTVVRWNEGEKQVSQQASLLLYEF